MEQRQDPLSVLFLNPDSQNWWASNKDQCCHMAVSFGVWGVCHAEVDNQTLENLSVIIQPSLVV